LPACAVDEVIEHWPKRCACGHVFSVDERRAAGEPTRHQVEELPPMTVAVVEHRAQRVRCRKCGARAHAALPAEVAHSAFGPRLQAALVALSVRNRVSRRDVVELAEELFAARISTGAVDAILARAGEALAEPYGDLLARIRDARALNVDETGWRTAGERRALWGAFTKRHALFAIAPIAMRITRRACSPTRRGRHLRSLVGICAPAAAPPPAVLVTPAARFTAHAEGLAAEQEFGVAGLQLCERVFWAWEVFCHTRDRRELRRTVRKLQRSYKPIIRAYAAKRARNKRCRGMARNLLKAWPALWTFAAHKGVERPTTTPSARCAARSSTASSRSARNPRRESGASSACSQRTPPAGCNVARCSPT